jgi:hypothetical protein
MINEEIQLINVEHKFEEFLKSKELKDIAKIVIKK